MLLIEECHIAVPENYRETTHISEEEAKKLKIAREQFIAHMGRSLTTVALVRRVYRLLDELTAQYLRANKISCKRGCGYCCHQLVCCNTLEMKVIVEYIQTLPRKVRREIIERARKKAKEFHDENGPLLMRTTRWEEVAHVLRKQHFGKPCLYLAPDQTCSIYPARPLDCRVAKTKGKCGHRSEVGNESPVGVRLFCDQVASNLITEAKEMATGTLAVTPLIAWPITVQFSRYFS